MLKLKLLDNFENISVLYDLKGDSIAYLKVTQPLGFEMSVQKTTASFFKGKCKYKVHPSLVWPWQLTHFSLHSLRLQRGEIILHCTDHC